VAYAIGVARPVGVYVNTFGTAALDEEKLGRYIAREFDFRPKALIDELDLLKPVYRATAAYGHFGRPEFAWERTDRAEQLAADLLKTKLPRSKVAKAPAKKSSRRRQA
jgi:S-adenosylmethionine synthetase